LNFKVLIDKIRSAQGRYAGPSNFAAESLCKDIGMTVFRYPEQAADLWFRSVLEDITGWDKWNGNLMAMAFDGSVENKRLLKIIKTELPSWFARSDEIWEIVKKELK
jgi:hypothetical protein